MEKFKNIIVANFQGITKKTQRSLGNGRVRKPYTFQMLEVEIKAQIDNAIAVGWTIEDIMLVTNFSYEYRGIKSTIIQLNDFCMTGSKTFAILELMKQGLIDGPVWLHDLDVWQTEWFDLPEFKDVGICTYSTPKFNGGSVFYRPTAQDMVQRVVDRIVENEEQQEEPTINKIYKQSEYKDRVTVCDQTYNLGCSGFTVRYERASKPIKCSHFHPTNKIAVDTHMYDRNMLGDEHIPVNDRLRKLLFSYFPVLKKYNLEVNGKKAQVLAGIIDPVTNKKIKDNKDNKDKKEDTMGERALTELDRLKQNKGTLIAKFDNIRSVKDSPEYKEQWEDLRRQWKTNETYIKYLESPESMYNPKYYKRHFEQYRDWEIRLSKYFSERYGIKSVLDIGCGVGSYLEGHIRAGVTHVRGVEYNYKSAVEYFPDVVYPHISYGDATKKLDFTPNTFDCVWSVEVAEHIMPNGTDQFIDNLVGLTDNYILLTAAPPGQSGTGHINLRPKQFWIDAITAKGFNYLEDEVTVLQTEWDKLGAEWYITKNVMLFQKK
jgi:hypothetical protein